MIYVICPSNRKTGGTELLHQLVNTLNKNHIASNIVYKDIKVSYPTPEEFLQYCNTYLTMQDIEDKKENIVVFPEIYCNLISNFSNAKKIVWWLSVDNYCLRNSFIDRLKINGFKDSLKCLLKKQYSYMDNSIRKADLHLCQSYYAMDYLEKKGISSDKILYLSDYINDIYFHCNVSTNTKGREDIVLYNPKKGEAFTKKLIKSDCTINWKPLINMTNEEVVNCLNKAKVYIDFGNHPGKDRIPREAAISGCCIITGKKGSAKFYEDVMIPDNYKYKQSNITIKKILNQIHDCLDNYQYRIEDFSKYREYISGEKEKFVETAVKIFSDLEGK